MKEKLLALLKLDAKATDEQIVAEVGKLNDRIASMTRTLDSAEAKIVELSQQPPAAKIDPRIRQKMAAGLSFQQAAEVIASQDAEDKAAKKAAK